MTQVQYEAALNLIDKEVSIDFVMDLLYSDVEQPHFIYLKEVKAIKVAKKAGRCILLSFEAAYEEPEESVLKLLSVGELEP